MNGNGDDMIVLDVQRDCRGRVPPMLRFPAPHAASMSPMDNCNASALVPVRKSSNGVQSPRHLRLVVTIGCGKPFSCTFSGPGTLWARIEPETAPKSGRPATTYSLNAHCPSNDVCSPRPNRSKTCDGFPTTRRGFSRLLIRIARLSGSQGVDGKEPGCLN
jgi:hypothetical protein